MPVRLEPVAPRSRVKHSTTKPLRSNSEVVVLLLLIYFLCTSNCLWGFCVGPCFGKHFCVLYSFTIIFLTRKIELVALL